LIIIWFIRVSKHKTEKNAKKGKKTGRRLQRYSMRQNIILEAGPTTA
jgi:hypothetical protein